MVGIQTRNQVENYSDSEMQETDNDQDRPYDLVIIGASGFTGRYVLREALNFLNISSSPLKSLAVAGRNRSRLVQAIQWATATTLQSPPSVSILSADTSDPASLQAICRQTKLIVNCVGPFRLHGQPVVAASISSGCDYLDICGEVEFMERMEAEYQNTAMEAGSLVVSACGFDSIPAELGFMFHSRQWLPPAAPNSIHAYLHLDSDKTIVGNFATYESAILGVANKTELLKLRRSRPKPPTPSIPGAPPSQGPMIEHQKMLGLWAVRLPCADPSVVRRTIMTITEKPDGPEGSDEILEHGEKRKAFWSSVKPAHFVMKLGTKSLLSLLSVIVTGLLVGLLGKSRFGRWLALSFPYMFSLGRFRKRRLGEEEAMDASFKMWFVGRGFSDVSLASQVNGEPDKQVVTRVMGPEAGYITTSVAVIQCALIVLSQRHNLPKGGVFTPGVVFGPTDLQERLSQNGMTFEVVSK